MIISMRTHVHNVRMHRRRRWCSH